MTHLYLSSVIGYTIPIMALYHTHRPQNFAAVIEQAPIITTLINQLQRNTVGHAYLFSGPRGVGKTTTARVLAKALNCEQRTEGSAEPCDTCTSCREITAGHALDVIEIDAASNTGVDSVRQNIIESVQFQPSRSKYKIFIIDEVHMLSTAAFNALLKTLEEPPAHVVFVLATTETHKVPATIISRCQRFVFKKVPVPQMIAHLQHVATSEKIEVEAAVLERIAKKSDGCVRDGMSLLEQVIAVGGSPVTAAKAALVLPLTPIELPFNFLQALLANNSTEALNHIRTLVNDGQDLIEFGNECVNLARVLLVASVDAAAAKAELDTDSATCEAILGLSKQVTAAQLVRLADMILARVRELPQAPIASLPLELLVIEWTHGSAPTPTPSPAPVMPPQPVKPVPQVVLPPTPVAVTPTPPTEPVIQAKPMVTAETPTNSSFSRTDIEKIWPAFMTQLEQNYPSLVFLLKMATIKDVSGDQLTVGVQYSFHEEKLMQPTNRRNLETILSNLTHATVRLAVTVDAATTPSNEVQSLAAAFGGQIVT